MPAISFPVNALFVASRGLPSCSMFTLHLPCTNEERKRAHTPSGVFSYKDTHPVGPTLITTFNSNYILTPNTVTLRVRSSTHEFWRGHNSVRNTTHFGLYSQITQARMGLN